MFDATEYELVDFGNGRKLERFGGELLDRPSPAAEGTNASNPALWEAATARFDLERRGTGQWSGALAARLASEANTSNWSVAHGKSRLLMGLNAAGNVGVFPEQAANWDWIGEQVKARQAHMGTGRPRVLNLFAYTGGASLAAAIAGAEVTHVDSSGPTVAWARRNAGASGVADLPIRWLVEDAMKFVARECRRANRYDGVILDPPTYGHGPKGKPFKFAQHVGELVELCSELLDVAPSSSSESTSAPGTFLLFSCHAPGFGPADAVSTVANVLPGAEAQRIDGRRLVLETSDGRSLEAGVAARWSAAIT